MSLASESTGTGKSAEKARFKWEDPLLLEELLTEEERMVRDTAQAYAQEKLMPRVLEANRNEVFHREIMNELGELGLLGSTLPEKYGCAGVNNVCYGLIAREVERVDSGYRSALSVQSSLVMWPIYAYGSEDQRMKYLPKLATGEWVGAFGLTEPDHGSDPGSMVTRAKSVDGGFLLNGAKMWISNAPIADVFVVWAKDDEGVIRGFILERGMTVFPPPRSKANSHCGPHQPAKLQWTTSSCPRREPVAQCARPRRPVWLPQQGALRHLLGRHWVPPKSCWHAAREYTTRAQAVRAPPGGQSAHPEEARGYADRDHAGPAFGCLQPRPPDRCEDKSTPEMISLLKRNNAGKALDIARVARDMHGGNGISDEYHVIRHVMNLESVNTYEGTHDIHALILGRRAQTGLQAFTGA